MIGSWLRSFPDLAQVGDPYWRQTLNRIELARLSRGEYLFRNGEKCRHYVLMAEGRIRVSRTSDSGREIVVYRIKPGQTCLLTTAVIFSGGRYSTNAITETDSLLVLLSVKNFERAFERSPGFRQFVCAQNGQQVCELVMLLERLAFGDVDTRLAHWLLTHRRDSKKEIEISHVELAREIGTAREVVSRRLKSFERHGWVRLGRRQIQVADEYGLMRFAPDNGNGG
jgi:CRP/FNR family transcriptional regulator